MYVILDRALPHIGDGLKPVQRRIVYAMSELGLKASAKFKKVRAHRRRRDRQVPSPRRQRRLRGHGADGAGFSYRYPLVDGQGNWGSPDDPKSFAAMRYTESRLTAYAEVLLGELGQGTVDWVPNFDGTWRSPLLPAQVPNVLLNGTTGIAVGMATDIPPHNLREVAAAAIRLLEAPKTTLAELCEHRARTGLSHRGGDHHAGAGHRADLRHRPRRPEDARRLGAEHGDIVVTALPFQASGARVWSRLRSRCRRRSCRWSPICATSRITRTPRAW
jgi:topoisomerase-4 subunit A